MTGKRDTKWVQWLLLALALLFFLLALIILL
jgi:hypothetical protein